uniref:INCENP_ARK-bind domain-containing protein n=1 Tax=Strongyloides papillosus TaxID=174720 RepID=A0A0N5B334_STREA
MPFSIEDIPEDAYTFMTNFNFNDSYIDNDELLRLCRFEENFHVERPRVRRFSQVCKFGEDVRISRKIKSLTQQSLSSSNDSIYQNSQFLKDFSKMNTGSVVTNKKEPTKGKNINYKTTNGEDDENVQIFNFNIPKNYEEKLIGEEVPKETFIYDSTIDERCFNGEYIEPDNYTSPDLSNIPLTSSPFSVNANIDTNQSTIPLKKEETDFWRHLSRQEF